MGLRDRLFARNAEQTPAATDEPAAGAEDEAQRAAMLAHLNAMFARGSITDREYRQEYRRLFGEEGSPPALDPRA